MVLLIFSLAQCHVTLLALSGKRSGEPLPEAVELPAVTVQLPVYNEYYVVGRLIDAVAAFDYPAARLEIQVLDDSTDETSAIISERVNFWKNKGCNIRHLQRDGRKGYKAGALQFGLEQAQGEFIAIFDADFLPAPDFLRRAMRGFTSEKTGMVQARWTYLNEQYSWLTRIQAFFLDAHFLVEQRGRHNGRLFFNFNGTAGVWRKNAITDAGGWEHDTITEDLDLSYRAQLRGWQFNFLEDLEAPSELPVEINAVKSQQYRWAKGSAETGLKLWAMILRAKIPFRKKLHALFHVFNSTLFVFSFILVLISVPFSLIKLQLQATLNIDFLTVFILCFINLCFYFFISCLIKKKGWKAAITYFLLHFPVFIAFSMAFSFFNSLAVLRAWLGYRSEFVRTPKFNVLENAQMPSRNRYVKRSSFHRSFWEGLLALYFFGGLIGTCFTGEFLITPFFLLLTIGFGSLAWMTVQHNRKTSPFLD